MVDKRDGMSPPKPPDGGENLPQKPQRKRENWEKRGGEGIDRATEKVLLEASKKNLKHHLLVLLMVDGGLRASEAASLRICDIDVSAKALDFVSLKSGGRRRTIPMTDRLYQTLTTYVSRREFKPNSYLFPTASKLGYITRQSIHKFVIRYSGGAAHPHALRHTCATKLANEVGADLPTVRDWLGHKTTRTTEGYVHADRGRMAAAARALVVVPWYVKAWRFFFPAKELRLPVNVAQPDKFEISRRVATMKIKKAFEQRVNLILLGPQGVGKSVLLKKFRLAHENVIYLADLTMPKSTVKNILRYLSEKGFAGLMAVQLNGRELETVMQKESTAYLLETLFAITERGKWTLMIEDISRLNPSQCAMLEKFKDHFHVVTAARSVKIQYQSFLTNFQRLDIENFDRNRARQFIFLSTRHMVGRIANYQRFETHVWNETGGNPGLMKELIERLGKEAYIGDDELGEVAVVGRKSKFDLTVVVLLLLGSLMLFRYYGKIAGGHDAPLFTLIGGAALVFVLFARTIFQSVKQRFV